MNKSRNLDFRPIGKAIKAARDSFAWTREYAAELLDITPTYLKAIENEGANPSLQLFYNLVHVFSLSVDEFFYLDTDVPRSTLHRQMERLLDDCDEKYYPVIRATLLSVSEISEDAGYSPDDQNKHDNQSDVSRRNSL